MGGGGVVFGGDDGGGWSGTDALASLCQRAGRRAATMLSPILQAARPQRGGRNFSADHGGQTWRFASDEHRQQFLAAPQNYLPQYGGYCAYAASLNALAFGDPEEWTVRGGKLYFNYNAPTRARWEAEAQQHIVSADRNWPSLADKQLANTESDN